MSVSFPQSASLTLRLTQGTPLTYEQMDDNWVALRNVDQNIINLSKGAAYTGSSNTFTQPQTFLDNVGITGSLQANWAIFNGQVISNFPGVGFNGTASWALNTVGGGGGGVGNLQQVTTVGNTTNLGINVTAGDLLVKGINVSSSIADLYTGSGTLTNVSTYLSSSWTASYQINSASFSASIADLYTMSFTPTNVSTYLSSSWTASYQINSASFSASIADLYTMSFTPTNVSTYLSSSWTGSYNTGSWLGNVNGTASWSQNTLTASYFITSSVTSASYALTASYVNPLTQSVSILGDLLVNGTITASVLYTQVITSSVAYITGSTIFGSELTNTHQFTGSVSITGSTTQTGNNTLIGNTILSGSIDVSGSTNFHNTTFTVTGSQYFTGSSFLIGNQQISGNLAVSGTLTFSGSLYVNGNKQFNYGNFYSTQSQTNPVANTSHSLFVETDAGSVGVTVVNQNQITVQNTGVYNLQFSTQFQKTTNGTDTVYVWFKKNGTNIADSATALDVTKTAGGGGKAVAAWNIIVPLSASNYVEIVWQSSDTTMETHSQLASGNIPGIPSTIATLTQIA